MTALSPRFWEIFFEVYESLPRQGPGKWHAVLPEWPGYATSAWTKFNPPCNFLFHKAVPVRL